MKARAVAILTLLLLAGVTTTAGAWDLHRTEDSHFSVGGQLHLLGSFQYMEDPIRDDLRPYLFLDLARLYLDGSNGNWRYRMSAALGGEADKTGGAGFALLDLYADAPLLSRNLYLRFGQFKVPYGRERLADPSDLLFVRRSVDNLGSNLGRDVGAALAGDFGPVMFAAGVFTGGGINTPVRDIPLALGSPMFALRLGVHKDLDEDIFAQRKDASAPVDKFMAGLFLNAAYTKDSQVGHSTVMRLKGSNESIVLNPVWNPYLAAGFSDDELWQAGVDAVLRSPAGPGWVAAELEGNVAGFSNEHGSLEVWGARGQLSYGLNNLPLQVALRYGVLFPGGEVNLRDKSPIHQVTPSLVYRLHKDHLRLVADIPMEFNTPTVLEANIEGRPTVGRYLLTSQVNELSYGNAGFALSRENVYGARLSLQGQF